FGKGGLPGAERLCRTDLRRGAIGPAGGEAERPRRPHRMGRAGAGAGGRDAAGRHELLRQVGALSAHTITSLSNPTVKAVRALHLRKERDETGLFVAEGLKNVIEGVDTGHAPKILMHGPDATEHAMMRKAVEATVAARGQVIEVTQDILAKVS